MPIGSGGIGEVFLPSGGTAGQVPTKVDGQDYNLTWGAGGGGGGGVQSISAGTTQATGLQVVFSDSPTVSFGVNGGTVTASAAGGGGGGAALSAGTQSGNTGTIVFSNSNGLTFGMSGSTRITGSYTVPGATVFSNSNNVSFGLNGSTVTATVTLPTQTVQPVAVSGSNGSFAFSTLTMGNLNGLSFYTSNGSVVGSYTTPAGGGIAAAAGTQTGGTGTILFSNSNGVSFGMSNSSVVTASVAAQTNQSLGIYGSSQTTGQSSSSTVDARSMTFVGMGVVSVGMSGGSVIISGPDTTALAVLGGIQVSDTTYSSGTVIFSNANGLSFGSSAGGAVTGSYTVPTQTNQSIGLYASSQTTGQSSSSTRDARSISIVGAGLVSVGWSNSSLIISATAAGGANPALSANNGSFTYATASFSNVNNVSFVTAAGSAIQGSFALNVSATGGTSVALSGLTFKDSQGVSFGLSTGAGVGTITASVASQTVQTQASGAIAGSGFTSAGNNIGLSGTHNSAGLSLSATVAAQTNQTLGIYASSQTFGQSSSSTHDARSLSVVGSGGISVGWSNSSLVISGGAGGGGVNIAASNTTFTSGTVVMSAAGGAITISSGAQSALFSVPQTSSLSATGMVSISSNGSTISIGVPVPGFTTGSTTGAWTATNGSNGLSMVMPYLTRMIIPSDEQVTAVTAPANASMTFRYMDQLAWLTATRLDMLMGMSFSTTAGAGTQTFQMSAYAVIYTKNAASLSSLSSGSTQSTWTMASNTAGQTQLSQAAIRYVSVPININMQPGEYYVGVNYITTGTAVSVTQSIYGGNDIQTASNYAEMGSTTNATTGQLWGALGVYSAASTGMPAALSLSAINQTGSAVSAANVALVFRNA